MVKLAYFYFDGVTKYADEFIRKANEPLTTLSGGIIGIQNFYAGPFEITNKYVIVTTTDQFQLHATKTTEATPGDGDWSTQDSANSPKYIKVIVSYWAFEFNSDIHIAVQLINGDVSYNIFDPGTDTWTVVNEKVANAGDVNFDFAPANPAVSLSVRSDTVVIIIAAYNDGTNEKLRLFSGQVMTYSWGRNSDGQLGDSTTTATSSPVQTGNLTTWNKITVGHEHVTAIRDDQTLWVWGNGPSGQLGDGTTVDKSFPVQVGTLTDWFEVDAGDFHTLAIKTDGTLWAWGLAANGRLGNETTTPNISSPIQIGSLIDWLTVSAGGSFSAAIKTDGTFWTWGANASGQLGQGDTTAQSSPVQVGLLTDWLAVHSGVNYLLATKADGTLWAIGANTGGQLGDGTVVTRSSPVQIGLLEDWGGASIDAGGGHSLVVKNDGTLWAWGDATRGKLGNGTVSPGISSPIQIGLLTNWKNVHAGSNHSIAVKTNGTLWAWGESDDGRLGNDTITPDISSPIQIGFLTTWDKIDGAGEAHSVASLSSPWINVGEASGGVAAKDYAGVAAIGPSSGSDRVSWIYGNITDSAVEIKNTIENNTVWTWGNAALGRIGNNTVTPNISSPAQLGSLSNWKVLSSGNQHTHVIKTDGTLWAWGVGNNGRLGNGSTLDKSSPIQIGELLDWEQLSASSDGSFAIKTDGTLWAWGFNATGKLGDGTTTQRVSPVQIGSLTDWAQVSSGSFHTLAIKTDGTLWAWGSAGSGALGNGTTTPNISSPIQIGLLEDWAQVSADGVSQAIKTDGTLWAWGNNNNGNLGDGTTTTRSSPVQIGSLEDWAFVSAGGSHGHAIKTDGTLWSWGFNNNGQLADGITTTRSSPVQVGSLTDWRVVSAGGSHSHAIKTDSTLWSWGSGTHGRLGDGTTVSKSSPVQIGLLSDWFQVGAGGNESAAIQGPSISPSISVDTTADTANIITAPGVIDSANKIYAPYIDSDDQLSIASWTNGEMVEVSIDSTLTVRTVFGHGKTFSPYNAACLADDVNDIHLIYYDDINNGIYHEDDIDGAIGSDTQLQTSNITLWSWGDSVNGRLGDGQTTTDFSSPIQIGALVDWSSISAGNVTGHAIKSDGTLWGWGINVLGGVGDNTTDDRSSPVQIGSSINWKIVASAALGGFAINLDGELYAWGFAGGGRLGNGTTSPTISSPIQIGSLTDWLTLDADDHSLAIKTDGTLWVWGVGSSGKLGDGTTADKSSPVQIGSGTNWAQASAGTLHSLAVKTDGTLWAWGAAVLGRLGNGTDTPDKSSPVQIGSLTDWLFVAAGETHSHAIKKDGTLWAWGSATHGILGNGTSSPDISSPIQIGTLTDWTSKINTDGIDALAIKKDGTLWSWGRNGAGKLGQNVFLGSDSPVQVGSLTNWSDVSVGNLHTHAMQDTDILAKRISARIIT